MYLDEYKKVAFSSKYIRIEDVLSLNINDLNNWVLVCDMLSKKKRCEISGFFFYIAWLMNTHKELKINEEYQYFVKNNKDFFVLGNKSKGNFSELMYVKDLKNYYIFLHDSKWKIYNLNYRSSYLKNAVLDYLRHTEFMPTPNLILKFETFFDKKLTTKKEFTPLKVFIAYQNALKIGFFNSKEHFEKIFDLNFDDVVKPNNPGLLFIEFAKKCEITQSKKFIKVILNIDYTKMNDINYVKQLISCNKRTVQNEIFLYLKFLLDKNYIENDDFKLFFEENNYYFEIENPSNKKEKKGKKDLSNIKYCNNLSEIVIRNLSSGIKVFVFPFEDKTYIKAFKEHIKTYKCSINKLYMPMLFSLEKAFKEAKVDFSELMTIKQVQIIIKYFINNHIIFLFPYLISFFLSHCSDVDYKIFKRFLYTDGINNFEKCDFFNITSSALLNIPKNDYIFFIDSYEKMKRLSSSSSFKLNFVFNFTKVHNLYFRKLFKEYLIKFYLNRNNITTFNTTYYILIDFLNFIDEDETSKPYISYSEAVIYFESATYQNINKAIGFCSFAAKKGFADPKIANYENKHVHTVGSHSSSISAILNFIDCLKNNSNYKFKLFGLVYDLSFCTMARFGSITGMKIEDILIKGDEYYFKCPDKTHPTTKVEHWIPKIIYDKFLEIIKLRNKFIKDYTDDPLYDYLCVYPNRSHKKLNIIASDDRQIINYAENLGFPIERISTNIRGMAYSYVMDIANQNQDESIFKYIDTMFHSFNSTVVKQNYYRKTEATLLTTLGSRMIGDVDKNGNLIIDIKKSNIEEFQDCLVCPYFTLNKSSECKASNILKALKNNRLECQNEPIALNCLNVIINALEKKIGGN